MVNTQIQLELLELYGKSRGVYSDFTETLSGLIGALLNSSGIQVHTITSRCKSADSLAGKLSRPEKSYRSLSEITDLAGLRITTYFAGDVDLVAGILEREFQVDSASSVDKRRHASPDRFGYSSLHYVVQLRPARTQLLEYSRFDGLKCEIQVRSILQHAWAEIEHDLGYKSAAGVPAEIRRRFARVASLLELADDEFGQIRISLKEYETSITAQIVESPATVSLNLASFRALFDFSSNVSRLDDLVIAVGEGTFGSDKSEKIPHADRLLARLQSFGVSNVEQLERIAEQNSESVSQFVQYWLPGPIGRVSRGIGVFYLLYVLASQSRDLVVIKNDLNTNHIGDDDERSALAQKILGFSAQQGG